MSVRKRTWKTAKGEMKQAWIVDYADQAGKRRLKSFDRKKEADAFEVRAKTEIREGVHVADSATVSIAKAGEMWLSSCEQRGLERATIDSYRQAVVYHINPLLGRLKLSQLSAPRVRQFEDELRSGGADEKPRSIAMVRKVRAALSIMLGDAMERGLVNRNVARELRARRQGGAESQNERRQRGKLKLGVDIPLSAEIATILRALEGMRPRQHAIIVTATFTGLRGSELRGLRWTDVDFGRSEIHVKQRADRYGAIGKPKSASGERAVPMPPLALNVLRRWKLTCPKSEMGLVFATASGTIVQHTDIVNRGLIPACVAAGVVNQDGSAKYTGLHALRHFFASWCINRKSDGGLELPIKVVQERMGHSSIVMTADRYAHLFPRGDDHDELAEAESRLRSL
jgi:integrase